MGSSGLCFPSTQGKPILSHGIVVDGPVPVVIATEHTSGTICMSQTSHCEVAHLLHVKGAWPSQGGQDKAGQQHDSNRTEGEEEEGPGACRPRDGCKRAAPVSSCVHCLWRACGCPGLGRAIPLLPCCGKYSMMQLSILCKQQHYTACDGRSNVSKALNSFTQT